MPRMFIAETVKPPVCPRPRARYRSWMEDGCTPTAWPISQISQRASSRSSGSPNTAVYTSLSIAGDAMADSSWTVTRPSRTVTDLLNGFTNMAVTTWFGSIAIARTQEGYLKINDLGDTYRRWPTSNSRLL